MSLKAEDREHCQEVKDRAVDLYFKIEAQYTKKRQALTMRDVNDLLGLRSSSSSQMYVGILRNWGWIDHDPRSVGTIVPSKSNPPVFYYIDGELRCVR